MLLCMAFFFAFPSKVERHCLKGVLDGRASNSACTLGTARFVIGATIASTGLAVEKCEEVFIK